METSKITRRGFLKGAGAVIAGLFSTAACAPESNPTETNSNKKGDRLKENTVLDISPRQTLENIASVAEKFEGATMQAEESLAPEKKAQVAVRDTIIEKKTYTQDEAIEKVRAKYGVKRLSFIPHDYLGFQRFLNARNEPFTALLHGELLPGVYSPAVYDKKVAIVNAAKKNGLSPNFIAAIMTLESSGDSNTRNHAGPAMGAMQVMPWNFSIEDFPDELRERMGDEKLHETLDYMSVWNKDNKNLLWNEAMKEWVAKDGNKAKDVAALMMFMRDDHSNLSAASRYINSKLLKQINVDHGKAAYKDYLRILPAYFGGPATVTQKYDNWGKWTKEYADRFTKLVIQMELSQDLHNLNQPPSVISQNIYNLFS